METIKQIVFRESDLVVMIIPKSDAQVIPRFLNEMQESDRAPLEALKTLCRTFINSELKYVVYVSEGNALNIEGEAEAENVTKIVSEMSVEDKAIVDNAGLICTQFINA